jgi:hypothetical protein
MLKNFASVALLFLLTSCGESREWISLFDAQSLGQWQGDPNVWRVENGYISGKAEKVDIRQTFWGSLYDEGTGPIADTTLQALETLQKNDWNKIVIKAEGRRLSVTVNGVQAALYETATVPEGIIALQYHAPGENFEIRFRNLWLKRLE